MVVRNERKIIRQRWAHLQESRGESNEAQAFSGQKPHHVRPRRCSHAKMLVALAAIGANGCSRWLEMGWSVSVRCSVLDP